MRRFARLIILMTLAVVIASAVTARDVIDRHSSIVRHNADSRNIYLIFSADSMFEGAPLALDVLAARRVKASFFFTGNFLGRPENKSIIDRVVSEGHYVGSHGDRHLLLADWDGERTPLVSDDSLVRDAADGIARLKEWGIAPDRSRWFLPPYEWIKAHQAEVLTERLDLHVINPTPDVLIYRDYTTPDMSDYYSSDTLLHQLYEYEATAGLNGAILIMHLGTQAVRTDKLYFHLGEIVDSLTNRGYTFTRFE